ncbi:carboxypeptidase B-like [Copidosoma floridanum]|uniref:carboxypeptidase B-like n=1 Tax=Copidosoma floridanum TaxID=29053 RepID=UPI0006C9617F|nr:carboxypeptidase B-like [Copidosoma floridanum]
MQGLRLHCDTWSKLKYVSQFENQPGFDFLRHSRNPNVPTEVLVPADLLDDFKLELSENRIAYEIFIEDVSTAIDEGLEQQRKARLTDSSSDDILKSFPRYDEIKRYLDGLWRTHRGTVTQFVLGKSFEGRDIVGVKISSSGTNKPAVFIDAGIHAREWIAPTTAIYAVRQLVENVTNSYLFDNVDIYVVPSLNVDGYEYTHKDKYTRLWRKTRSINPESRCVGTDGNRNFDYYWATVGASNNPCAETYAGPKPFSEPETVALRDFLLSIENLRVYLSFHSYGNYILYPWSYTAELPENEPELRCVGKKAELALSKVRGTRFTVGSSMATLYASAGSSDDWAMAVAGSSLAYTIELPGGSWQFAPPPREILPVGQEVFEALKVFVQYADGEICQDAASQ